VIADRWGVTQAEVAMRFACDDLVPDPVFKAWRGVTVHAKPEQVWPWVAQVRLGPYSYDWIDNLGRRSPRELRGLPEPVVGEPFFAALGGRRFGRVEAVDPGEQFTGTILGAVMSYMLVPVDGPQNGVTAGPRTEAAQETRLLLKVVMSSGRLYAPLLAVGDLIMARRQLLNLAALAESTARG
jgi:hypothetical protein